MKQITENVMLIRPANFGVNTETAKTNLFQKKLFGYSPEQIKKLAIDEFDNAAFILRSKGINVLVFDDTDVPVKPDAVFPNNWVSFHHDGRVILYPMNTNNRMVERRMDIIDSLKEKFKINAVIDFCTADTILNKKYLEGTGSVVFDHKNKTAYACLSPRTDRMLFKKLSNMLNYKAVLFIAKDIKGKKIYHTNVMMCIGDEFCVICLESIKDKTERQSVLENLKSSGLEIISITLKQMESFCGNMISLKGKNNILIALSKTAFDNLNSIQKKSLEKYGELVPVPINTIETIGGGSIRCMIAEIFPEKIKIKSI